MFQKIKYSFVYRLVVFVVAMTVLAMTFSSLILAVFSWRELRATTRQDYQTIIKSAGGEIRTYLLEARNALEILGVIMAYTIPASDTVEKDIALTAFSLKSPRFSSVRLIDAKTGRVIGTDSEAGEPISLSTPFMRAALSGKSSISKVYYDANSIPIMKIAVPVKRLGSVDEVLCGELNLKSLWELLEGIRIGKTGYISVLDAEGQYVGDREVKPVITRMTFNQIESLKQIESSDRVLDWIDTKSGYFCMAYHVADIDWFILLHQPIHEMYGHLNKSLIWVAALTLAACLVATLLSRRLTKRLLLPLNDLHRQAKIIGQGELDHRIETVSRDEIGDLARAFNEMAASLQTVMANRLKIEKELAHARNLALIGKSASKMNHEVGNLLNKIGLFFLYLKEQPMDKKGENLIGIIEKDIVRARNFIQACLQFAKKPEINRVPLSIKPVVEEALVAYRTAAREMGIDVTTKWDEDIPKAPLDYGMIHQVIQNLVKNSLDALEGGNGKGRITIRGSAENGHLCLSIRDNGPGIAADIRGQIFEPFFTTKGRDGTGLGLPIIQEIAAVHGGRIECVPPTDGGAEFRLYFPLSSVP